MSDPYSLLGVSRSADDTEIKKAYRTLSKKYHPDNNPGDKNAEEKFKQIQAAYEQIMNERKNPYASSDSGNYGGFGGFGGSTYQSSGESSGFDQNEQDLKSAYVYIQNGYYTEALNVLNGMSDRNARWYYYSAIANLNSGNNITALQHAKQALSLDPSNYDYAELVEAIESGSSRYTGRASQFHVNTGSSNTCLKIIICNLALNLCFGGGGLFCGNMGGGFGQGPGF